MLYLYLILCLTTITTLYTADEKKLSQEEISQQIALLFTQMEQCGQRINKVEAQIEELHKYDRKLNKQIKKFYKIFQEKQLEQEKAIKDLHGYNENLVEIVDSHHTKIEQLALGRCSSCPELITVDQRLDMQEKELLGFQKRFATHEVEHRSIKEDLQSLAAKQRKSEERDESTKREIQQLKQALSKNKIN